MLPNTYEALLSSGKKRYLPGGSCYKHTNFPLNIWKTITALIRAQIKNQITFEYSLYPT